MLLLLLLLLCEQAAEYRPLLTTLFSRYVDPCLEHCRRNFKTVVPLPAVSQVCMNGMQPCTTSAMHQQHTANVKAAHSPKSGSGVHAQEALWMLFCLQVMSVCKILEGILPKESVRGAPPPDKKLLEYHFVFACVWAFGGCMLVDKVGSGTTPAGMRHTVACLSLQS